MENLLSELQTELDRMSPKADLSLLRARLEEANQNIRERGILIPNKGTEPLLTGYYYHQFYDWDLYFENIYALYNGESRFCFSNLRAFFALQKRNGFIRRSFGAHRYGYRHPFKPFIAQIMLLGCATEQDYAFADQYFTDVERYLAYYEKRYDSDHNGLCCWVNADASGMDNQNSRVLKNGKGEGVDLNCYLYREYQAMAVLAEKTGRSERAEFFTQKAQQMADAVRKNLWDDQSGFFYDRNEKTGELHKVKGVSGFVPLWAGIATQEQADRLVKEHLINPGEFSVRYPIPTLAKDEPAYSQIDKPSICNWNGPSWIPMNYMVFHGLMHYSFEKEAKSLAFQNAEMALTRNGTTREFYNAETGEGYGCNPFFGWSTLAYYMPVEYLLRYDPTQICDRPVEPLGSTLGVLPL